MAREGDGTAAGTADRDAAPLMAGLDTLPLGYSAVSLLVVG